VNFSPDQYSNNNISGGGLNSSFSPSKAFPSSNNPSSPLDPNYILANKSESVDLLDFDRHDSFLDDPSLDHYLMDGSVKKVSLFLKLFVLILIFVLINNNHIGICGSHFRHNYHEAE
jgi:hypothetical protein